MKDFNLRLRHGGGELAATYCAPAKARSLSVMVHGGPGGVKEGPSDLYVHLARHLAHAGVATLRFDFLGAGESSGDYQDMTLGNQVAELNAVWQFAESLGFDQLGCVAESYGATSLLRSEIVPDATVLLWPAIDLLDVTFAPYVTPDKLTVAREQGYVVEEDVRVGLAFLEEVQDVNTVRDGFNRISERILFIHVTSDSEVPHRQSEMAYQAIDEPKSLLLVEGGDHCLERDDEREIVYRETTNWLKSLLLDE